VACVQASALYGAELWWEGSGVGNRRDKLQKLQNQLGGAITGNFRTTNLGVVMAESGREPTEQQKSTPCAELYPLYGHN